MKSTKKLTIPIDSHLSQDKRSAIKNREDTLDGSDACKNLAKKFKNFKTIKGVVGNFESSLAKFDNLLNQLN